MIKLYDVLVADVRQRTYANVWDILVTCWGEGTVFAAACRVEYDIGMDLWTGYLVFQDERFSPLESAGGRQFKYLTPAASSGELAEQRARETWETLKGVFTALMFGANIRSPVPSLS